MQMGACPHVFISVLLRTTEMLAWDIGPAEMEAFKMWRRENNIHNNTLHKQLLLIRKFFQHARKHG
jgi:hypothetical protein